GYRLTALRGSEIELTGYHLPGVGPNDIQHKLFVFSSVQSFWNEAKCYQTLQRELARLNLKNVVLWSYLPTFVGCFGVLGERLSVFDAVDNWLEHSSYLKVKDRLKVNYQTIRARAGLIFTTAQDLTKIFDRPQDCTYVPNGVDVERILSAPRLVGRDIASLPRPIIGYIGTIQEDRVDVSLIQRLAEANPQKSFVLIGGVWPGIREQVNQRLRNLPNVHLLGRKSFRETPQYLREFSVAIIPHKQNEFNRHTNPMKLYEYLAAGKPVVATPGAGLEGFADLVYLAATPEQFNTALIRALQEDSVELRERRQAIAAAESWQARVKVMLGQVFAKLGD
ncbi:MAG: glycosyltransferase, partial [Candidatus Veblenbacteria bacterium]|nr:glycosyltransferase [Candidatus Veblenbacteria bacterium]